MCLVMVGSRSIFHLLVLLPLLLLHIFIAIHGNRHRRIGRRLGMIMIVAHGERHPVYAGERRMAVGCMSASFHGGTRFPCPRFATVRCVMLLMTGGGGGGMVVLRH